MKTIDGDAAVWLLRKHDMYEAAELIRTMPVVQINRRSQVAQAVENFLASGASVVEIDVSAHKTPLSGYQTYREHLRRRKITACYVYMDQKRVFLARVPGRATDGKTANIRN